MEWLIVHHNDMLKSKATHVNGGVKTVLGKSDFSNVKLDGLGKNIEELKATVNNETPGKQLESLRNDTLKKEAIGISNTTAKLADKIKADAKNITQSASVITNDVPFEVEVTQVISPPKSKSQQFLEREI